VNRPVPTQHTADLRCEGAVVGAGAAAALARSTTGLPNSGDDARPAPQPGGSDSDRRGDESAS
jgi:hypothetical protein